MTTNLLSVIEQLVALGDWHYKTSELWPIGMEQSTFHNKASLSISAATEYLKQTQVEDDYKRGFADGMKEAPTGEYWIRAIDEAMVGAHLGVADMADDYGTAKKKLNDLICWSVQVDRDLSHPQATEPIAECCEHGARWDTVCRSCDELPAIEPAPIGFNGLTQAETEATMGAQLARAIKAEAERDALKAAMSVGELTDEQIMHIFDTHVGEPNQKYPLNSSDWKNFARAILAAARTQPVRGDK